MSVSRSRPCLRLIPTLPRMPPTWLRFDIEEADAVIDAGALPATHFAMGPYNGAHRLQPRLRRCCRQAFKQAAAYN